MSESESRTPTGSLQQEPAAGKASSGTTDSGEDSARDQARAVGGVAKREAGDTVGTAKDQASRVAEEAASQASGVVSEATERLHEQARHQSDRAAESLRRAGGQMEALADGRPEDAGPMEEYARQAATQVTRAAERVESRGLDGLIEDVEGFARRRPGAFVLGTAAAGFLVGRLGRNRSSETA